MAAKSRKRGPARNPDLIGRATTKEDKVAQAWAMYKMRTENRWSYGRIAEEFGVGPDLVRRRLNTYCPKLLEADAEEYRQQESDKLDAMEEKLWELIGMFHYRVDHGKIITHNGAEIPDFDPVFKAINQLVNISKRRAALLGLDKPVKVENTGPVGYDPRDEELAAMIEEGRSRGALK